jgi:hypothetical protein
MLPRRHLFAIVVSITGTITQQNIPAFILSWQLFEILFFVMYLFLRINRQMSDIFERYSTDIIKILITVNSPKSAFHVKLALGICSVKDMELDY